MACSMTPPETPAGRTGRDPIDDPEAPGERLQKVLAAAGVGSRRRCEVLIDARRVAVNGEVVTRQGMRIDPTCDAVTVDGRLVSITPGLRILACHKPRGVVSAMSDPHGRRCLADLLPAESGRLFHVGRLDADSTGLILLTNDGELGQRLSHPRYGVPKTYVTRVAGRVTGAQVRSLVTGVSLDDGPARAVRARIRDRSGDTCVLEIVMHEGRNRIVRRMCEAIGHPVIELARTAIGPVHLGGLPVGRVRELTAPERSALLADSPGSGGMMAAKDKETV